MIGEIIRRIDGQRRARIQGRLLTAYQSLAFQGKMEVDWLAIAEREAEHRFPARPDASLHMIGQKKVERALGQLEQQRALRSRVETATFTLRTIERRLYSQPQESSALPTSK